MSCSGSSSGIAATGAVAVGCIVVAGGYGLSDGCSAAVVTSCGVAAVSRVAAGYGGGGGGGSGSKAAVGA